ncbi:unnamed protein product, partial [marine sediment metagenome]
GVATMIVVNAVMAGFTHEMEGRMHDVLSDISFQSRSADGFSQPEAHLEQIRRVAGEYIAGMTPTVNTPALLSFELRGENINRPVHLIGIDEATYGDVGDFGKYLQHPENRRQLSFQLRAGGYDERDHQAFAKAPARPEMKHAGWSYRRHKSSLARPLPKPVADVANGDPFNSPSASGVDEGAFDPAKEQHTGLVLGIALATYPVKDGKQQFFLLPGDDVRLVFPGVGIPGVDSNKLGERASFTVVDFYESKMSEYDSTFVFVPLQELQRLR